MRIAIVNDLGLAITAIRRVIEHEGRHSVAWVARDGMDALARFAADEPDLVLLDLVMPQLDGVQTTRRIRERSNCPVLIVTAHAGSASGQIFEAMGHGALDVAALPQLTGSPLEDGRDLLRKIATVERLQGRTQTPRQPTGQNTSTAATIQRRQPPLIAIGSSTGGPKTLAAALAPLPPSLPAALVVVQHIDAQFAPGLVDWLNTQIPLKVGMAESGQTPQAGMVLVAVSNDHLVIRPDGRFAYQKEPVDEPYRPSVDVFFHSLVNHWRDPGVAVLLTGMGRDGGKGMLALRQAGWHTIAQDEASCAVYGMPKAAVELGGAVEVLAPEAMARSISQRIGR
ncbi:MAG: chemotaxis-specific protein-glutamate methyltransferase CheB [Synechococcus sp. ELA057]